jgi:predicted dehydrogenase
MDSSRRHFIKLAAGTAAAIGAAPGLLATGRQAGRSANDRIRLATIGVGGMGIGDTRTALQVPGVEVVAAADVYDGRFREATAAFGEHLFVTRDYREILARPDIDAVIIATPDHWHARQAIDALNAGKHVYLEKPMVRTVDEGHRLIEAHRKSGRVLIVGSQFVSSIVYLQAKALLASGALGELNLVEAYWNRNSALSAWQYPIPEDASPVNVDWDRFLGEAPKVPFQPIRLFRWRNYQDYGTGVAGDLFVHLFSSLHLVTGSLGPTRIMATGGLRHWKDGRDVPDIMVAMYDYPDTRAHPGFNLTLKVNFVDGSTTALWGESGFRFNGSEGVMTIARGVTLTKRPRAGESDPSSEMRRATDETWLPPDGYDDRLDHFRNFFSAIREGTTVVEDAVFGLRAAAPAVLSNTSHFEERLVAWDPEAMTIVGA